MMEIELHYSIGDQVWLMHDDKAICGTIEDISYAHFIDQVNCSDVIKSERYSVNYNGNRLDTYEPKWLFNNKKDLIKSL